MACKVSLVFGRTFRRFDKMIAKFEIELEGIEQAEDRDITCLYLLFCSTTRDGSVTGDEMRVPGLTEVVPIVPSPA